MGAAWALATRQSNTRRLPEKGARSGPADQEPPESLAGDPDDQTQCVGYHRAAFAVGADDALIPKSEVGVRIGAAIIGAE
jgi:hypothetical protein